MLLRSADHLSTGPGSGPQTEQDLDNPVQSEGRTRKRLRNSVRLGCGGYWAMPLSPRRERWRSLAAIAMAALVVTTCSGGATSGSTQRPPPPPRSTSPASLPISTPTLRAVRVARLDQPLGMAVRADDPALYVVSKLGRVWAIRAGRVDSAPALDLSTNVSHGSEQGLLGMAFSPDGKYAYVNYTDLHGNTNVVEYVWSNGRATVSTKRLVLFVKQPFPNHNGGDLVFGPDGYLYIGLGDGGATDNTGIDPHGNGQNLGTLLGKMLRIDPRPTGSKPYGIPVDNPFQGQQGARPEVWAYGLRNPWRYSFDRQTGDLWIADVGAGKREEVDFQSARSKGGQNYGWSALEGTFLHAASPPPNAVPPVYEYGHDPGGCAIIGGYVYRGMGVPALKGWYVFGDLCLAGINALRILGGQPDVVSLGAMVPQLVSFGEDQQGELYALSLAGGLYKLEP